MPLNRNNTRNLSPIREDQESGIFAQNRLTCIKSIKEDNCLRFIARYLNGTWTNYLENDIVSGNILLIRKMFTQGNLEMLRYLPPLRGIMVWRDPRNHYAQLVTND